MQYWTHESVPLVSIYLSTEARDGWNKQSFFSLFYLFMRIVSTDF